MVAPVGMIASALQGLVNGQTTGVAGIEENRVGFEHKDGVTIALAKDNPQLQFSDHAWQSAVNTFQERTLDTSIAAMESRNTSLVKQQSLYVPISRAQYRADLIRVNRPILSYHPQPATE